MLFFLFVYFLTQSNIGGDASPIPLIEARADTSCDDLNNCRTIWSIIGSCLYTIILCTWVILHPNISIVPDAPGMSVFEANFRNFLKNKLVLFIWALLVPEYILAWAIRQYLNAGEIQQKCITRQRGADGNTALVRQWTRSHGFFVIMGGFHLYSLPDGAPAIPYAPVLSISSKFVLPSSRSRGLERAEHPLEYKDFVADQPEDRSPNQEEIEDMNKGHNALAYLAPTETEIKDRGKADVIAKVLAILQTSWFATQCIARGVKKLPLTELEIITLAYVTMNASIYYFWWDKPKDVGCPIRVYMASKAEGVESGRKLEWGPRAMGVIERVYVHVIGVQDRYSDVSEKSQVPMYWSGKPGQTIEIRSMFGASVFGLVFGAIHFIAWNSEFRSYIEHLFWRISCVAMTAVPLTVTIVCSVWPTGRADSWLMYIIAIPTFALPLTGLLYIFSRLATLVMAFTTLRALPPDAFKTVDWASFLPHF